MPRGRQEIIGYGDYRRVGPDYGMQEALTYGVYQPLSGANGLSGLLDPLLDTEQETGLVSVRTEAVGPAVVALQSMSWVPLSGPEGVIWGKVTFLPPPGSHSKSGGWVTAFVAQGYAVMIETASVPSAEPNVAMTNVPQALAELCRPVGGWALLTGPADLIIAAQEALKAGLPISDPSAACYAGGGMWDGESSQCVPRPAEEEPPPPPAKTASWVLPVAVIGGIVVIAGVLLVAQRG